MFTVIGARQKVRAVCYTSSLMCSLTYLTCALQAVAVVYDNVLVNCDQ